LGGWLEAESNGAWSSRKQVGLGEATANLNTRELMARQRGSCPLQHQRGFGPLQLKGLMRHQGGPVLFTWRLGFSVIK